MHHTPPGVLSAISVALARGISGADFECATSEVPGMCAFSDPLRAVLLCPELEMCQSMVALMGGERWWWEGVTLRSGAAALGRLGLAVWKARGGGDAAQAS